MPAPDAPRRVNFGKAAREAALLKELDSFKPPGESIRASVSRLPNSASGKQTVSLPLGFVLQPLAPSPDQSEVPALGSVNSIIRCTKCRSYVNPFVQWRANGRQWTCSICGFLQATPDEYVADLDDSGKRVDRYARPELCRGTVEYEAPAEFMVHHHQQPPVFMFVIDVSRTAVVSGFLEAVIAGIREALQSQRMPGGARTRVGIMTFDTSLHFYSLSLNYAQPPMYVVADLEDIFLPTPAPDILVNARECQTAIFRLLDQLPSMFFNTHVDESCLGSAVQGASLAMQHVGGKMLVFGACIPSLGACALKSSRENNSVLCTDREVEFLVPSSDGFKEMAIRLTQGQVSLDLFMAPQGYVDLASLAPLAKYTGGDVRYYGGFQLTLHGLKLMKEVVHVLTRNTGWQAVMRVRVSNGWKISKIYGHFNIQGINLVVVPNVHEDQTFAVTIDLADSVAVDAVLYVQCALLYTNSDGERRIRVHTWASLTSGSVPEIVNSVDVQATVALLSNIAVGQSVSTTLAKGRTTLQQYCQHSVQALSMTNAVALQYLSLYIMGMLKSPAFRSTRDVSADVRIFLWMRLETLPVEQVAAYYCPRLVGLHDMPASCGLPGDDGRIVFPDTLRLTSESLTEAGIYLLDDGESMLLWLGKRSDVSFIQSVFGMPSFDQVDSVTAAALAGTHGDPLSDRVGNIIAEVRSQRKLPYLHLHVLRQGEPREFRFFSSLIEDKALGFQFTYAEFLESMGVNPCFQVQPHPHVQHAGASPMNSR